MEPVELREQQRLIVHELALRLTMAGGLHHLHRQVEDPRLASQQLGVDGDPVLRVVQAVGVRNFPGQQPVRRDRLLGGLDALGIGLICDVAYLVN